MTLKNQELTKQVSTKSGIDQLDTKKTLDALTSVIIDNLKNGNSIRIKSVGKLEVVRRNKRKGRNPQTNERLIIKEHNSVLFKVSSSLYRVINEDDK